MTQSKKQIVIGVGDRVMILFISCCDSVYGQKTFLLLSVTVNDPLSALYFNNTTTVASKQLEVVTANKDEVSQS